MDKMDKEEYKDNVIKLSEARLRKMIKESVKNVMNEVFSGPDAQGPSAVEEKFDDELYAVIDNYKDFFLEHGYSTEDFYKWCCDIVKKAIGL